MIDDFDCLQISIEGEDANNLAELVGQVLLQFILIPPQEQWVGGAQRTDATSN